MTVVPSSCILTCTANAFPGSGCTSYTDLACSCNNEQLLQSAAICIESTCPADEELAREYNQQECAAFVTTTFSFETSTTQAAGQQTSTVTAGSGNSNSGNNSNTSSNQNKSSTNIGAIVGGVVGGVFVILLAVFVWWYIRTHPRRAKRNENDSHNNPKDEHWKSKFNPEPTPGPIPAPYPAPYPSPYPSPYIPEPRPTPPPAPYIPERMPTPPPAPYPYLPEPMDAPTPAPYIPDPMPTPPPAPYPAPLPYPQPSPYVPPPAGNVTPTPEDADDGLHYAPPGYESVHGHHMDNTPPVNPAPVPGSNEESKDDLRLFADRHRSHISSELEEKLRVAHYRPGDDPSSVPENVWVERYNIGVFELRRLQEVYDSSVPLKKKTGTSGEKGGRGSFFAGPARKR